MSGPQISTERDYDGLKKAVEAAGFFTTFMPIHVSGDRIVLASKNERVGLSGVSFWIAKRGTVWFISPWGGWIYRIPQDVSVEAAGIDALRSHKGTPSDFTPDFKTKFSLVEVTAEEFDRA